MPDPRLDHAAAHPRLIRIGRVFTRLGSAVRILIAGAHPDDEPSSLIARWSLGDGHRVHYVCVTRGQGGQNSIGPETGASLGVLRAAEMAVAAKRLGMSSALLDTGAANDPLADFGFSKSAEDTLRRWGAEEVLRRLVREIRSFRPDVVLPCFLDVPGQHGHHRAMTRTLLKAWEAAAEPAFGPDLGPAWTIGKLYLPAWSGAGESYDDAEPPPPATTLVDLSGYDALTGMSWEQLGEWSRAAHASQGMGVWPSPDRARHRPLHLLASRVGETGPERGITDGLPASLADFDDPAVAQVAAAVGLLRNQFPHDERMRGALAQVRGLLAGIGEKTPPLAVRLDALRADLAALDSLLEDGLYTPSPQTKPSPKSAWLTSLPAGAYYNLAAPRPLTLPVTTNGPCPQAILPPGWLADWSAGLRPGEWRLTLQPAAEAIDGTSEISFRFADGPAVLRYASHYPHVGPVQQDFPAHLRVALMRVALPLKRRLAVLEGERTDLGLCLQQLGFAVTGIEGLASADAILIGPMGWRRCPEALARRAEIFTAVARGARLVTLYHRPMDHWGPDAAVQPLTIGTPSLRFRACEPDGPVTVLEPTHALFTHPNPLSPTDWQGWVRERGLYFAQGWQSAAWQPLLAVHDRGEEPLLGSLLVAEYGEGQQVHCALALHHQIPALVPGAARLLVNLLSTDRVSG
ncbi:PIG-L family deacetylase [Elstera sp.]|uniref:PIG-L family deacetylase n=1 Tax=Elstera sp. TaxID=1916664 RepID=UPI0037C09C4D